MVNNQDKQWRKLQAESHIIYNSYTVSFIWYKCRPILFDLKKTKWGSRLATGISSCSNSAKSCYFWKNSANENPSLNVFGWFTHLQWFYLSGTKINQFGVFSGNL